MKSSLEPPNLCRRLFPYPGKKRTAMYAAAVGAMSNNLGSSSLSVKSLGTVSEAKAAGSARVPQRPPRPQQPGLLGILCQTTTSRACLLDALSPHSTTTLPPCELCQHGFTNGLAYRANILGLSTRGIPGASAGGDERGLDVAPFAKVMMGTVSGWPQPHSRCFAAAQNALDRPESHRSLSFDSIPHPRRRSC